MVRLILGVGQIQKETMEYTFIVKYDTGRNEFSGLDAYQGAHSLQAISEILMLIGHASVNDEMVVQAPSAKGFRVVLAKSKIGSFEQYLNMVITDPSANWLFQELGKDALLDIIKYFLYGGLGLPFLIKSRKAKKKLRELEAQNEDLSERLRNALIRAHLPVKASGYNVVLSLTRTPIVEFNSDTLNYLETEIVEPESQVINAAISKFNARTGTGRLITSIDSLSYPFTPLDNITHEDKDIMADNLGLVARGEYRALNVIVTKVTSSDGRLKRYHFHGLA